MSDPIPGFDPGAGRGVPQGAVCATHIESPAVATCQRCGTFVCTSCLVVGTHGNLCVACAPKIGRTPWEERTRLGVFGAFVQTARGTLLDPSAFFRTEPVDPGYGSPILWAMLCGFVGGFFALVWGLVQTAVGAGIAGQNPALGAVLGAGGEGLIIQVVSFLAAPILIVVTTFIQAGLTHLCLMMVGGANRTFDTTFRTFAYCSTTQLFQIVPLLGGIVHLVWNVVVTILGLATAHGTSTGKTAAAVLLPICVVLGGLVAIVTFLVYTLGSGLSPVF